MVDKSMTPEFQTKWSKSQNQVERYRILAQFVAKEVFGTDPINVSFLNQCHIKEITIEANLYDRFNMDDQRDIDI